MRFCPTKSDAILCGVLLTILLALWGASYRHAAYVQHRDTIWTGHVVTTKSIGIGMVRGLVVLKFDDYSMDLDPLFQKPRITDTPAHVQMISNYIASWGVFHPWDASWEPRGGFHGWDASFEPRGLPPVRTVAYDSIFGLNWSPFAVPGVGFARMLQIPVWMFAALLAIPIASRFQPRRKKRSRPPEVGPIPALA